MAANKESNHEITFGIFLIFLLIICVLPIYHHRQEASSDGKNDFDEKFLIFIKQFNKSYQKNDIEYQKRFDIFKETLTLIETINSTKIYGEDAKFGLTKFSDLTDSEFSEKYLQQVNNKNARPFQIVSNNITTNGIPKQLDWRAYGIVTNVRNQGLCGSCYAQSVIATIESVIALKQNFTKPVEFSVQQMIDCARNSNHGCFGGDTCALLEWLKVKNISIFPNKFYPDSEDNEKYQECQTQNLDIPPYVKTARVVNYTCLNFTGYELSMLDVLAHKGPMAASVNGLLWKNYIGGVIKYHCNGPSNHAVQIVGYDLTSEVPHYIVRNSWGTDFGVNGYAKIAIGGNVCNIASEVSSVHISWG